MKIKSVSKHQRVTPRKVNRILDLIRGEGATKALAMLNYLPHSAAKIIHVTLHSAVANAKNNHKLDPDALVVSECYSGPSTPMKRFRAGPRGRGLSILKRTSHITIFVEAR